MWVVRSSAPRGYAPGVLELPPPRRSGRAELSRAASPLHSQAARLRQVVLPYLERLQGAIDETVNLTVRTGDTARFIISLEGGHVLRVGSREGMVFPAHQTSGGVVCSRISPKTSSTRSTPKIVVLIEPASGLTSRPYGKMSPRCTRLVWRSESTPVLPPGQDLLLVAITGAARECRCLSSAGGPVQLHGALGIRRGFCVR